MSADTYSIAVFGACGATGREVLTALEGEGLPIDHVIPVGATLATGMEARWRGRHLSVVNHQQLDVQDIDAAILAVPAGTAPPLVQTLRAADVMVIDLSGTASQLPLLWPTLDAEPLESHPGGVAIPCAGAATLAPFLSPLAAVAPVAAIDATVLAPASAAGRRGEEALSGQTLALMGHRVPEPGPFSGVLAFNAFAGSARASATEDPDEARIAAELAALVPALADATLRLSVVHVPLSAGSGISLTIRWAAEVPTLDAVRAVVDASDELLLAPGQLAVRDATDVREVLVGLLQQDPDGAVRCFLAADSLQRTAEAAANVLAKVIAEDLW